MASTSKPAASNAATATCPVNTDATGTDDGTGNGDVDGRKLSEGGGSIVIQGNQRFKGTGHNAVLREAGVDYLVYHAYDADHGGKPALRISPIYWTPDGWPRAQL